MFVSALFIIAKKETEGRKKEKDRGEKMQISYNEING